MLLMKNWRRYLKLIIANYLSIVIALGLMFTLPVWSIIVLMVMMTISNIALINYWIKDTSLNHETKKAYDLGYIDGVLECAKAELK